MSISVILGGSKVRMSALLLALVYGGAIASDEPFIKQVSPDAKDEILSRPVTDTNHKISTKPVINVQPAKPTTDMDEMSRPVTDTNHKIEAKPTIELPAAKSAPSPSKTKQ
ncbi:hypothetical protein ACTG16_21905 [Aeromonas sp. 23P]|uniref:hypothetical protein n=1 Tax=Aeromonas sp. 23P TaxID=3452716 RepID=UPI003F7B1B51|nr:hypothetical protein [Aeromonas veronii]